MLMPSLWGRFSDYDGDLSLCMHCLYFEFCTLYMAIFLHDKAIFLEVTAWVSAASVSVGRAPRASPRARCVPAHNGAWIEMPPNRPPISRGQPLRSGTNRICVDSRTASTTIWIARNMIRSLKSENCHNVWTRPMNRWFLNEDGTLGVSLPACARSHPRLWCRQGEASFRCSQERSNQRGNPRHVCNTEQEGDRQNWHKLMHCYLTLQHYPPRFLVIS